MTGRKMVSQSQISKGKSWIARSLLLLVAMVGANLRSEQAVQASTPPLTDIPEEVLRTEIITEARSPIDGSPLSAVEFAELVVEIQEKNDRESAEAVANHPKFKELFFLIRLRSFLRSVGIPIK
jgi:hypothetical protein